VISDTSNTVVATVNLGGGPYGIAYDSAKGELFVTVGENSVSLVSDVTNAVTATILVRGGPIGEAYDSAKAEIFVADGSSGNVSVISDSAPLSTVTSSTSGVSTTSSASAPPVTTASTSSSSGSSVAISWNYLAVVAINAVLLLILGGVLAAKRKTGRDSP
jgi:DNA-binding beta-propeller fold protein YncE